MKIKPNLWKNPKRKGTKKRPQLKPLELKPKDQPHLSLNAKSRAGALPSASSADGFAAVRCCEGSEQQFPALLPAPAPGSGHAGPGADFSSLLPSPPPQPAARRVAPWFVFPPPVWKEPTEKKPQRKKGDSARAQGGEGSWMDVTRE